MSSEKNTRNYMPGSKKPIRRTMGCPTWVDKYRPKTLNDVIGHENIKNVLRTSTEKGDLPHLLFHGSSGTGKTSTVLALVYQLYGPKKVHDKILELNASDENGINIVRDKIIKFANIVVGSPDPDYPSPSFKIIILDEADSMTSEAQTALKKVMETTCEITRFVIICNYESKIIGPIKSRCVPFRFNPIPQDLMIDKLKKIAKNEKLRIRDDVYKIITDKCKGDARLSINTLQNIKSIPGIMDRIATKEDLYSITSYIDRGFYDIYWDIITNSDIENINILTQRITNMGYSINHLLECLKDKINDSNISGIQKSKLMIQLGKTERMVLYGADDYIQLLSIFSYINGIYKNYNIDPPEIF